MNGATASLVFFNFYAAEGKGENFSDRGDPTMILGQMQKSKGINKIVRVRSGTTGWRGDEARFVSRSSFHNRKYVCVEEVLASHKRLDGHTTKEGLTFFLERAPRRCSPSSTKAPVEAVILSQGWGELHTQGCSQHPMELVHHQARLHSCTSPMLHHRNPSPMLHHRNPTTKIH